MRVRRIYRSRRQLAPRGPPAASSCVPSNSDRAVRPTRLVILSHFSFFFPFNAQLFSAMTRARADKSRPPAAAPLTPERAMLQSANYITLACDAVILEYVASFVERR
uniref:Uncharacterized protein n=1 Tax=Rhipicephalus zambeziensis TaxID=60191 RepID=A0A224Y623_9ACAR